MNKLKRLLKEKSNSGSSLVTAVVVVAFLSILGTIALYISGENYKMKVIDANNKRSFYEAEEVVEVLKTQLMLDVASAAQNSTKVSGATYVEKNSVEVREENYLKGFAKAFEDEWNSHWSGANDEESKVKAIEELFNKDKYNVVVKTPITGNKCVFTMVINGEQLTCEINDLGGTFLYKDALEKPATLLVPSKVDPTRNTPSPYKINNFKITVTNSKGVVSVISTSFLITPPALNWDSSTTLMGEKGEVTEADYTDSVLYLYWSKE